MAQHDMVVENGTGLAVRTDMNAAILALVTLSSGPLAPPIMYAGMLWLDTSVLPNGLVRQRDLANATWIDPQIPAIIPPGVVRADIAQSFTSPEQEQARTNIGAAAVVGGLAGLQGWFAMATPPTGWLKANGALVSRTTYAALFAAIGTTFGAGDGTTTFQLPDLRAEFMRGWDDARGVDVGRVFGSAQADEFAAHSHGFATISRDHNGGSSGISFPNGGPTGYNTGSTGGVETRPRNIALLGCIRY